MDSEERTRDVAQPEVWEIYENLSKEFNIEPEAIKIAVNSIYNGVSEIFRSTIPEDKKTYAHIKLYQLGVFTASEAKLNNKKLKNEKINSLGRQDN